MTRRSLTVVLLAAGAVAMAGACTEVSTDPNAAIAIAFDSFPSPAAVIGDTLRGSDGQVAPLMAQAFNSQSDVIADAPIRFVFAPTDTGAAARTALTIDSATRFLVVSPTAQSSGARIFAQVNGVQSQPQTLELVPRPDRAEAVAPTGADTVILYQAGLQAPVEATVQARVLHDSAGADPVPVRAWRVEFVVDSAPALADSVLIAEGARAMPLDTTDASGVAARRVRVFPKVSAATRDSVIVRAHVTNRGEPLPGSPVRIVVPVAPRTGSS